MAYKVYVGDVETEIVLNTFIDLAGATVSIEVRKPNGNEISWPAVVTETTKVYYRTGAGDLDVRGDWRMQAKAIIGSGKWLGATVRMPVYRKFA